MNICILSSLEDSMQKDTGASVRIYNLAKGLAALGNTIRVIMPNEKDAYECIENIKVYYFRGLIPNIVLKTIKKLLGVKRFASLYIYDLLFISRLCPLIWDSDIVQIEQQTAGGLLIPFIKIVLKKPVVIDCHDVFQALRVKHTNILRKLLETFSEKLAYKYADMILTVSKNEKKCLVSYGVKQHKIKIIANGVDIEAFNPFLDTSLIKDHYDLRGYYTVIFVGNMEYLPNREAVQTIASKIAPLIKNEISNTRFLIVGRIPPNMEFSNLTFTGIVEDVAEFIAASDVAIAPIFGGSGTRLKILEYFSCGLPVVSSTVGIEGLDVTNGIHALVEDDLDRFALGVIKILKDKELGIRLGKNARELVVNNYNWKESAMNLSKVYHKFLGIRKK